MSGRLAKRHVLALERVFAREVEGSLSLLNWPCYPVQLGTKVAADLEARGLVDRVSFTAGRDAFGEIEISGHVLTHRGRMVYCEWASQQPEVSA